jgi:hypothetical protein
VRVRSRCRPSCSEKLVALLYSCRPTAARAAGRCPQADHPRTARRLRGLLAAFAPGTPERSDSGQARRPPRRPGRPRAEAAHVGGCSDGEQRHPGGMAGNWPQSACGLATHQEPEDGATMATTMLRASWLEPERQSSYAGHRCCCVLPGLVVTSCIEYSNNQL